MEFLLIVILSVSSYVGSAAIDKCNSSDEFQPWKIPYLPHTIQPVRYKLFLFPDFYYNASTFSGDILIEFKVESDTDTILVHSRDLSITEWVLTPHPENSVTIARTCVYNDYFVVQTNRKMLVSENCTYDLDVTFNGTLTIPEEFYIFPVNLGFYKGRYVDKRTGEESWYVATDFEPSYSRTAFPNLDEPRFKVQYDIVLRYWANFTALSNMQNATTYVFDHGEWKDTYFKITPKMSSYLASVFIGNFSFKENSLGSGQPNRVWARPDRLDEVDYALNASVAVENYHHQEFNISYPLDKLDHVALPQYASGAMEHWGKIVYRDSNLLTNVMEEGDVGKRRVLYFITHEMAHNYFGNLVTCRSWEHLWLNEGLATFYEVRAMTVLAPTLFHEERHFSRNIDITMIDDSSMWTNALVPVLSSAVTKANIFNDRCYYKGGAIARMVESFIGAELFRNGIRRYLKDNLYETVETSHLWAALQQELNHTDLNLAEIMHTWVYKPGFPIIFVAPLCGNEFIAVQEQFLNYAPNINDGRHIWHVPLNYRTKGGNTGLLWVKSTYAIFEIPLNSNDDWIQFNHDASGYYRVKYHPTLLERLEKQLNDDHTVFTEIARWKLLSDAASLVKFGQMTFDRFLNLSRYASKERRAAPWLCITSIISEIVQRIKYTTSFSRYQRYFLNLTTSIMEELQDKDENRVIEEIRPEILPLACGAGHRVCKRYVTRKFKDWIRNRTSNAIPKDIQIVLNSYEEKLYCMGLANSILESEWNTVYERLTTASWIQRGYLFKALTCSRNVTLLKRMLWYVRNGTLDNFYGDMALYLLSLNPDSVGFVFEWLKSNDTSINGTRVIEDAKKRHLGSTMEYIAITVYTEDKRQEVLEFMESHALDTERALRSMNANIRWMDKHYAGIDNWLRQNFP